MRFIMVGENAAITPRCAPKADHDLLEEVVLVGFQLNSGAVCGENKIQTSNRTNYCMFSIHRKSELVSCSQVCFAVFDAANNSNCCSLQWFLSQKQTAVKLVCHSVSVSRADVVRSLVII